MTQVRPVLEGSAVYCYTPSHLGSRILNPSKLFIVQTHAGEQNNERRLTDTI